MSELERLSRKIDKSNDKIDTLVETMTAFVAFQARAEERHDDTARRIGKLEDLVDSLWDMVHKNSILVNGAVAVVSPIVVLFVVDILKNLQVG